MKERQDLYAHRIKLDERYKKNCRNHGESEKCARFLLLHADVILCTLGQAGSKYMLKTFKDNMYVMCQPIRGGGRVLKAVCLNWGT